MDLLGFIMRTAWTISFVFGSLASLLVIYLTICRTPKKYHNNIFFMRAHAISELFAGFFGWISMPRVIPAPNDVVLLSYGPCSIFGPKFCFYTTIIMLQFLAVAATVVPLNIIVRLYILTKGVPKTSSLLLITGALLIPNVIVMILIIPFYAGPEEKTYIIGICKIDSLTFSSYSIFGFTDIHSIEFQIFVNVLLSSGIISSMISLFFRILILRKLNITNDTNFSVATVTLQKRIIKMLTIQALLPVIGFIPSVLYFLLKLNVTNSSIIQSLVLYVDSLFPIMSSLVTLVMVREYKLILLRRLGKEWNGTPSETNVPQRAFVVKPGP